MVLFRGGLTGTEVAQQNLSLGKIGPISDFIRRQAYTTAYDRRNRIPAWTAEHLTAASLKKPPTPEGSAGGKGGDRSNSTFKEDESIPPMFRAHLLDYFKSGYDRGHMVPAADAKMSQTAMDETFILSNVAPQVGDGFNRHYWAYLEQFCRTLTGSFEDVYVFTVPLFLPQQGPDGKWRVTYEMIAPQNSPPSIAVPTHFAKVILSSRPPRSSSPLSLVSSTPPEKEWSLGAFVLPNAVIPDDAPLTAFVVPVEAVEMSAGLTLVPDQLRALARPLCQTVECKLVVRRFDDAQKKAFAFRAPMQRLSEDSACQKADWKYHKDICHQYVKMCNSSEVNALAVPHVQLLTNAFMEFQVHLPKKSLEHAMANAYKLHSKPYLQNTHALLLSLEFNSDQERLQDQFVLLEDMSPEAFRATIPSTDDLFTVSIAFAVSQISKVSGPRHWVGFIFRQLPVFIPFWDHTDIVNSNQCLQLVPPPTYDWLAAFRVRLRNPRGENPEALMAARKTARAEERRLFLAQNPGKEDVWNW
ncbi:hypothetical protein RQP46_006295 [Phenoliferia psychrophenolica]